MSQRHGGRRLSALYALATEMAQLRDLQSVLRTALTHCISLTQSHFGFIGLSTPDETALDVVEIQGFDASPAFYQRFRVIPLRPNLFVNAILQKRPVRTLDALHDPQRVGQPAGHPPVRTFLGVPLLNGDGAIGMIGLANRPTEYVDENESLLETYAAQVTIAIQNARLNDALAAAKTELEARVEARTQELHHAKEVLAEKAGLLQALLADTVTAEERERQRIAQDLHDGPNQLLVGAMLELKSASERLARGDRDAAAEAVTATQGILHRMDRDMRQTISQLRPPILDALGLMPSLRRCVEVFEAAHGIRCEFEVHGAPYRLPDNAEICIYRIMQESMSNIARHARASRVHATVSFAPEQFALSVRDDGCGFDVNQALQRTEGHFGLLGMRERAVMIGGRLMVNSKPGLGSEVQVWLPVMS